MAQLDFFSTDGDKPNSGEGFELTKPLAFFDLETTGIDVAKDRIVEMGILIVSEDNTEKRYDYRVNPTIPIPAEASAVHGIYDDDVKDSPTFEQLSDEIFELLNPCDLAGYNSNRFDVPVLVEEFLRVGKNFDIGQRKLVDVHRIFTKMEQRTLSAAYKFYCDKNLEDAHSASADTFATYEVLKAQIERYGNLRNDVSFLHDFTNDMGDFIDLGRRLVMKNNTPLFNFGKHKGKPVATVLKEEPGYYAWIMNSDFSLHTKLKLKEIKLSLKLEGKL